MSTTTSFPEHTITKGHNALSYAKDEVISLEDIGRVRLYFEPSSKPNLVAIIQTFDADKEARREFEKNEAVAPGDQFALVDLRNVPIDSHTGCKKYDGENISRDAAYIVVAPGFSIPDGIGYKVLAYGEEFTFGRNVPESEDPRKINKSRFSYSAVTSRKHFNLAVDLDGSINIEDLKTTNGTRVFTGEKIVDSMDEDLASIEHLKYKKSAKKMGAIAIDDTAKIPTIHEAEPEQSGLRIEAIINARKIEDVELVRHYGNDGNPIDEVYRKNNEDVRALLLDELCAGNLYESTSTFVNIIRAAHITASKDDVYKKAHGRDVNPRAGKIRRDGSPYNTRGRQAEDVAYEIASFYDDPYADRFAFATEGTDRAEFIFELPGIDKNNCPYELIGYNESGVPNNYRFYYPDGQGMPQYFRNMATIGKNIVAELEKPKPDTDKALQLIANQYQYAAIARPFDQINNSLFMNLTNMQIKLLGLNGIPHEEMDIVAQRLQPESFTQYFMSMVYRNN